MYHQQLGVTVLATVDRRDKCGKSSLTIIRHQNDHHEPWRRGAVIRVAGLPISQFRREVSHDSGLINEIQTYACHFESQSHHPNRNRKIVKQRRFDAAIG